MKYTIDDIDQLDALEWKYDEQIHIVFDSGMMQYNFLVYLKEQYENFLVLSNGAVDITKKTPPVFMRSKWIEDLPCSLVFLDDPTIHDIGMKLGWGQGRQEEFALEVYDMIIKKIAALHSVETDHIYYYGSSAGGFMSMVLASMHKGTKAIVNNPQTDVKRYHEPLSKPLIEEIYGSIEAAYDQYVHRLRVADAFEHYGNTPEVHYCQNRLCVSDMKRHYTPFLADMSTRKLGLGQLQLYLYHDKKAGHNPLGKERTIHLIKSVFLQYQDEQ
ncbi:hypothetical protein FO441_00915 [Salinicoccus cyprini]|uniref:Glycosyl transferase n=1 Tax=Salinicoccus cyprini TaxID=2493691 RepID=A0A558AX81_9STAP|nr:hypothetical protein [Salinicoccus cyprini]TVT28872.1 hypothetical protein FO441_00915 [Salinicoccus cyprini]